MTPIQKTLSELRAVAKKVPGFPGILITRDGVLLSIRRAGVRELRFRTNNRGYLTTSIWVNGKYRTTSQHRLLMLTFCPIPDPSGLHVDHINADRKDNRLSNLRWATPKENIANSTRLGRRCFGSKNPKSKLNEKQVAEIRRAYIPHCFQFGASALRRKYGIKKDAMKELIHGKTWKHVSPHKALRA